MKDESNISQKKLTMMAKALPKEERQKILSSFKETEIHEHLKELFLKSEPNYNVEITHRAGELGKDLVIVKRDNISTDVIAVVVKCGSIRARTAGDVDAIKRRVEDIVDSKSRKKLAEIESQIQQAVSHSAEMKTIFVQLPVSRVFVILVGEISGHVRKRLSEETSVTGVVDIFDINWLVAHFTDFYPQIFFESKVIDFFQDKIQQLELRCCMPRREKNLSDYFIEPIVASADVPIKFDAENLPLFINKRTMPFSELKNLMTKNKHLVLIGDPGIGKSSSLAKLSIDIFKKAYQHATRGGKGQKIEVPILISANELLGLNNTDALLNLYFGSNYDF